MIRRRTRIISRTISTVLGVCCVEAAGAELWNGAATNFSLPSGTDWTQASNQDLITTHVHLTRAVTRGIYNAVTETGYTSFSSPDGTEWAYGSLSNYASLNYTDWEDWNGHDPPSMVGQPAVLHLISDDIYLVIQFTSWGGSAGGFAYTRSTAGAPSPVLLQNPVVAGANFQFSISTLSNQNYLVQSTTNFASGVWLDRTNLPGDGSLKTLQFPIRDISEFFKIN